VWQQFSRLEEFGLGARHVVSEHRDKFVLDASHPSASELTTRPQADGFLRADHGSFLVRAPSALLRASLPRLTVQAAATRPKGLEWRWSKLSIDALDAIFETVIGLADTAHAASNIADRSREARSAGDVRGALEGNRTAAERDATEQECVPRTDTNSDGGERTTIQFKDYVEIAQHAVDESKPLLYRWEIFAGNNLAGLYIGKASRGSARPLTHYHRNVQNLLSGRHYRRGKPDGYRTIHKALAEAVRQRQRIVLTLLCNVPDGEDLDAWEARAIEEANSRGPAAWQLNG
jgi:hypothetical protein